MQRKAASLMQSEYRVDLDAYFRRIGLVGEVAPDLATLRKLMFAQSTTIPFENVDVLLGRGIRIDLPSIEQKLIRDRRGGYCFEQNGLFSAVLEQIGFTITRLSARVRFRTTRVLPRTHMLLLVETEAGPQVADAGFGGWGMLEPIPLVADQDVQQGSWVVRLRREGEGWVLMSPNCPVGTDQYIFTLEPQLPVDYELPNHYCATHPDSRFVQSLTAQLPSLTRRIFLINRELHFVEASETRIEPLQTDAAIVRALREHFGLMIPADTKFPIP